MVRLFDLDSVPDWQGGPTLDRRRSPNVFGTGSPDPSIFNKKPLIVPSVDLMIEINRCEWSAKLAGRSDPRPKSKPDRLWNRISRSLFNFFDLHCVGVFVQYDRENQIPKARGKHLLFDPSVLTKSLPHG